MEPITARALFTMVKNYSLDDDDEKVSAVSGEKGSSDAPSVNHRSTVRAHDNVP